MISVVSERVPGDPKKLRKPKELRGVRPFASYRWGGCTSCQAFIKGGDLWVKHNDWCSHIEYGGDVKATTNGTYIYSDNFAPIMIVRGQAWIRLEGVLAMRWLEAVTTIDAETRDGTRFCMDDWRMFRDLYDIARKEIGVDR